MPSWIGRGRDVGDVVSRQIHDVAHRKQYRSNTVRVDLDDAWRALAACIGYPFEVWFPWDATRDRRRTPGLAEQICAECPVRVECEQFGRATRPTDGIWGGLPPSRLRS